jgi:hypothetical protein
VIDRKKAGLRRTTSQEGMMTLVVVLVLSGLILAWGFMTSLEATSTHQLLRNVLARRLRDQAVSSAIEEACARIESARGTTGVPLDLAVPITLHELAPLGVSLAPVHVRSARGHSQNFVFEFTVRVRVDAGSVHRAWIVTARRTGLLKGPNGTDLLLEHEDLVRFVSEASA